MFKVISYDCLPVLEMFEREGLSNHLNSTRCDAAFNNRIKQRLLKEIVLRVPPNVDGVNHISYMDYKLLKNLDTDKCADLIDKGCDIIRSYIYNKNVSLDNYRYCSTSLKNNIAIFKVGFYDGE